MTSSIYKAWYLQAFIAFGKSIWVCSLSIYWMHVMSLGQACDIII